MEMMFIFIFGLWIVLGFEYVEEVILSVLERRENRG